jgi:poly(beta-D-mannuronate) lyase
MTAKIIIPAIIAFSCSSALAADKHQPTQPVPADKFDLSHWKITVPVDLDNNGKVDEVSVKSIQHYEHPDFFYLNNAEEMVFTVSNSAMRTVDSSNTRSELRQMLRGKKTEIKTHDPKNNFALAAHPHANKFAAIGGKLNATLKVNHVSQRAGLPNKKGAHAVVVGQIHAGKITNHPDGFGWGNEPLKIFFKKFPHHNTGSVFWTYERNLAKDNPNRTDIVYPVWGNTWRNTADPLQTGIALGESFSYEVNVYSNTMYLTFSANGHPEIKYAINLTNNTDANGNIDEHDHPQGYSGDFHYFKAGAYNQCSQKSVKCPGTGQWSIDKENGDYTSVAFSTLTLSPSTAPKL